MPRYPEARFSHPPAAVGTAPLGYSDLYMWTVIYPSGTVTFRGLIRKPFSHERRGRSVTIPPALLNPHAKRGAFNVARVLGRTSGAHHPKTGRTSAEIAGACRSSPPTDSPSTTRPGSVGA